MVSTHCVNATNSATSIFVLPPVLFFIIIIYIILLLVQENCLEVVRFTLKMSDTT